MHSFPFTNHKSFFFKFKISNLKWMNHYTPLWYQIHPYSTLSRIANRNNDNVCVVLLFQTKHKFHFNWIFSSLGFRFTEWNLFMHYARGIIIILPRIKNIVVYKRRKKYSQATPFLCLQNLNSKINSDSLTATHTQQTLTLQSRIKKNSLFFFKTSEILIHFLKSEIYAVHVSDWDSKRLVFEHVIYVRSLLMFCIIWCH